MTDEKISPPAPNPCEACPYRRDVPPQVWADSEYEKLPPYDAETPFQPPVMFRCHSFNSSTSTGQRLCAGWAHVHGDDDNLSLRLAPLRGELTADEVREVIMYETTVPLWASGAEAAEHGMSPVPDLETALARDAAVTKIIAMRPETDQA